MELPLAPNQKQPSAEVLLRAIRRADMIQARMVADEAQLDGATVFTSAQRPRVFMCNFAAEVRADGGQSAVEVLDQIDDHFRTAGTTCRILEGNTGTWPEPFVSLMTARGYSPCRRDVMLLTQYQPPARVNEALQILPGRAVYAQLRDFFEQAAFDSYGGGDRDLARQLAAVHIDHFDEPRAEPFVVRIDKQVAGVLNLVTLGQIGVIENLHVLEGFRGGGVATTLLAHAMDHCQRALFEQVVLEVDEGNEAARRLYQSLGFTPVTRFENYVRLEGDE